MLLIAFGGNFDGIGPITRASEKDHRPNPHAFLVLASDGGFGPSGVDRKSQSRRLQLGRIAAGAYPVFNRDRGLDRYVSPERVHGYDPLRSLSDEGG